MNKKFESILHRTLHIIESIIAVLTVIVLVGMLIVEIYHIVVNGSAYFSDVSNVHDYLHDILTIVVGLEFVRMLVDTTPSNILEVLTVAITRHVILTHDDPWSNLACIICIAALFATRRFLIRRSELKEELVEND